MNALALVFVTPLALFAARADTPDQLIQKLKDPSPRVRQLAAEAAGKQKLAASAPALGALLRDEDGGTRNAAVDALGQIGAKAVPVLVEAVGEDNAHVQRLALTAIGRIGPDAKDAVAALTGALKNKDTDVRIHAADALGKIGPNAKAALPALFLAAKDTSNLGAVLRTYQASGVAEAAVGAALKVDPNCGAKLAEAVLPDLIAALKDKDDGTVQAAASALHKLGPSARAAVPALEEASKSATGFAKTMIPDAIVAITGDATRPHLAVARDTKAPVDRRLQAVASLSRSNSGDKVVVALNELLNDPDAKIRAAAVSGLSAQRDTKVALPKLLKLLGDQGTSDALPYALARAGGDVVPELVAVLEDDKKAGFARFQVVQTLGLIGPKAKGAKAALERALEDRHALVAIEAACALVQVGGDIDKALPVVLAGLEHPQPIVARFAVDTISRLGLRAKGAVPDLIVLLKHRDREVRIGAAHALAEMGAAAKGAAKAIGEMLKSNDDRESYQAGAALARLGADAGGALPALIEVLKKTEANKIGPSPIHQILRNIGPAAKDAVPVLLEQLKTADSFYAESLMETLGRIGSEARAAVPHIAPFLTNKSNTVRGSAARSLGAIGSDAKETIPALKKLLEDEWRPTRVWAAYALARVTGDNKTYVAKLLELWKDDGNGPVGFESAESYAVEALALLGPDGRAGRDMLLAALVSEKTLPGIQSSAAVALGQMSEDAAVIVPKLVDLLKRRTKGDRLGYCCCNAAKALGALGPKAKDAVPQLQRLTEDEEDGVAAEAAAALKRITGKD